MSVHYFLAFFFLLSTITMHAQDVLPYEEIGEYPEAYTGALVAARMIDGLGYRYYWASKDLSEKDREYRPTPEARSAHETLVHLYGLSGTIVNASKNLPNIRPMQDVPETYDLLRQRTLENLKEASEVLKENPNLDLADHKVIFQRGENSNEFPYWNMINGPIADALYHTGQITTFRRITGNPIDPGVNVFMGKTRKKKD